MTAVESGKLGKYLIVGTLGRGAMGTVLDARDPVIDRRVAIKTITLPAADDLEAADNLERFKREAQAAGRLHHPNIVGVYDYGETDTIAYIIMEFVDGKSLKSLLDEQQRFAPAETVRIMEGVLAGLQYSHARGVVHRDIKPANIMLTEDGMPKIADFGIARIESSSMTQAGTIMGTPAYMSPEQFIGQTVDLRTDIYSAGVLLYQMLTGERPFDGSMTAIMHKAMNTEPPRPSVISVTSPVGLDAVVATAMAKRPEQRFASAASFAAAMRAGLLELAAPVDSEATMVASPSRSATLPKAAPSPVGVAETASPQAGSRAPLFLGIGVVGLALAAAAVFVFLRQPASFVPTPPLKMAMPPPALPQQTAAIAPPPQPASGVSRAALRTAVASAIAASDCAMAGGDASDDGTVHVNGVVGWEQEAALRRAVTRGASGAPVVWNLSVFHGPYCKVLDVLRPYAAKFGQPDDGLALALKNNVVQLKKNDWVRPSVRMPEFPAYITLDYFSSDGGLLHVFPWKGGRPQAYAPGATTVFGDPLAGGFQADTPFGTDLIVAVASDRPIHPKAWPSSDKVATFLPALRQALAGAFQGGEKVVATAMVVHTVK